MEPQNAYINEFDAYTLKNDEILLKSFHEAFNTRADSSVAKRTDIFAKGLFKCLNCWVFTWGRNVKYLPHYFLVGRPLYKLLDGRFRPLSSVLTTAFTMDYLFHQLWWKVPVAIKEQNPALILPYYGLSIFWVSFIGCPVAFLKLSRLKKDAGLLELIHQLQLTSTRSKEIHLLCVLQNRLAPFIENSFELEELEFHLVRLIKELKKTEISNQRLKSFIQALPSSDIVKQLSEANENDMTKLLGLFKAYALYDKTNNSVDREGLCSAIQEGFTALPEVPTERSEIQNLNVELGSDHLQMRQEDRTCIQQCQYRRKYDYKVMLPLDLVQLIFIASLFTFAFLAIQYYSEND